MAVLSEANKNIIKTTIMQEESNLRNTIELSKAELKAAIDATDIWINDNKVSFNNALPEIAKTNLTGKQKVLLFMHVAKKRWEIE